MSYLNLVWRIEMAEGDRINHPFVGQLVHLVYYNDTESEFYFIENYHHYIYRCNEIFESSDGTYSANLCIEFKSEGCEGTDTLDSKMEVRRRINIGVETLQLYVLPNRKLKHLLSTVEDFKEKEQKITWNASY
jgi:hypothetical protein